MFSALALVFSMQAATSRVVLATVRGALNQPLITLGPDDFLVREAGQPREVLAAWIADYPVIVLIDDGVRGGKISMRSGRPPRDSSATSAGGP